MKGIVAILLFSMLSFSVFSQASEEESIKKTYDSYNDFLSKANGAEAVKYVDSHTIQYYNAIAELSRDADSLKIESLPLLDKIMVLITRHRVPKEQLLKFDGRELFIYSIENMMVDTKSSPVLKLGTVTIDNDSAKAQLLFKDAEYPLYLNFYKEQGQWKYDLTSSFAIALPALKKYVDEMNEKLVINMMLNADPQHKPSPYIWRPIR